MAKKESAEKAIKDIRRRCPRTPKSVSRTTAAKVPTQLIRQPRLPPATWRAP